jgi:hypothetical protein
VCPAHRSFFLTRDGIRGVRLTGQPGPWCTLRVAPAAYRRLPIPLSGISDAPLAGNHPDQTQGAVRPSSLAPKPRSLTARASSVSIPPPPPPPRDDDAVPRDEDNEPERRRAAASTASLIRSGSERMRSSRSRSIRQADSDGSILLGLRGGGGIGKRDRRKGDRERRRANALPQCGVEEGGWEVEGGAGWRGLGRLRLRRVA